MTLHDQKDRAEVLSVDDRSAFDAFLATVGKGIRLVPQPTDEDGTLALQPNGVDFAKWLRETHTSVAVGVPPVPRRILHSHDIWIPLVFLANDIGLPIYLSLVSSYVYDKLTGALKGSSPRVHFSAEYLDGSGAVKRFVFEGPPEALKDAVEKFDTNKFVNG